MARLDLGSVIKVEIKTNFSLVKEVANSEKQSWILTSVLTPKKKKMKNNQNFKIGAKRKDV